VAADITIDIAANLNKALKEFQDFQKVATNSFKSISDQAKKTDSSISGFANTLKNIGTTAAGFLSASVIQSGFSALKDAFSSGIQEAIAYEDALNQLNSALAGSGNFSEQASADFEAFANSLEASSKFSDDAILSAGALIESLSGLSETGLKQATQASADLAAALSIDLESAARLVGKAAEGEIGTFKKYGIEIRKGATDAETFANTLSVLESRFGGRASAQLQTFSGATTQLRNAINDTTKELGFLVTKNEGVILVVNSASKFFGELERIIAENASTIRKFVNEALIGLLNIIPSIVGGLELIVDTIAETNQTFTAAAAGVNLLQIAFGKLTGNEDLVKNSKLSIEALKNESIEIEKTREERKKLVSQIRVTTEAFVSSAEKQLRSSQKAAEGIRQNNKQIIDSFADVKDELSKASKATTIALVLSITPEVNSSLGGFASGIQSAIAPIKDAVVGLATATKGFFASVQKGAAGAADFVASIAGAAANFLTGLPVVGEAVQQMFSFFAQGPELVKAQIQAFLTEIPNVLKNIVLAVPAFIEALINSLPDLVVGLIDAFILVTDRLPDILIQGFIKLTNRLPEVAEQLSAAFAKIVSDPTLTIKFQLAIIKALPDIFQSLIQNLPQIYIIAAQTFIDELIRGADRFVDALISALPGGEGISNAVSGGKPGGGGGLFGGGGFLGLGFAEGGRIPDLGKFENDRAIARVSAGEQILSKDLSSQLEQFLGGQGGSQNLSVNLIVGEQELASVILNLNRQGFRTA
jgi:hypothetical protein